MHPFFVYPAAIVRCIHLSLTLTLKTGSLSGTKGQEPWMWEEWLSRLLSLLRISSLAQLCVSSWWQLWAEVMWPWTQVPRPGDPRARAPCHLSQCEESGGSYWGTAEGQTGWYTSCQCSHVIPANYIWQTYSLYIEGLHYYCMVGGSQISGQFVTWWSQWQWQTTQWARLQWPWHWSWNPRTISTLLLI